MKKTACLLCALLLALLSVPAMANGWNLPAGLLPLFETAPDYNDYSRVAADADTASGHPVTFAFFHMASREHSELFIAMETGGQWAVVQSTTKALRHGETWSIDKSGDADFTLSHLGESYFFRYWGEGEWVLEEARIDGVTLRLAEEGGRYGFDDGQEALIWAPGRITLERFNIERMPRSATDVRRLNGAGVLSAWDLMGDARPEAASGTAEVYTAPSRNALRAADGKAAVSLQGGYTLLGRAEGWYLVAYRTGNGTGRIGYIPGDSISPDVYDIPFSHMPAELREATGLTDDPEWSQKPLAALDAGQPVTVLATYGPFYAYVETIVSGQTARGFVPLASLNTEGLWAGDIPQELVGKWRVEGGGTMYAEGLVLNADGTCQGYYPQDHSAHEMYLAKEGRWRVAAYDASWGLFWDDPVQMIIFHNDDSTVQCFGLTMTESGFALSTREFGGGFAREP